VTREQLEIRDVKGRPTYFAVIDKPGRATRDVLAEAIPAIIRAFQWPKSMRWGDASTTTESLRWVRPLSGILALFGDDVVPCEVGGVASGNTTLGHRFHSSTPFVSSEDERQAVKADREASRLRSTRTGTLEIINADDYADQLRAAHVIVDHEERQDIIRKGAAKAAKDAGFALVEDEGLVIENAGLTEWPVPLLGRFDEAFLDVPEEVIQLTARVNQKYFVCRKPSPLQGRGGSAKGAEGEGAKISGAALAESPSSLTLPPEGERGLTNAFVCTANIEASGGGKAIIAGNEKVLAARLSDAKFFWELDQKTKLADHAKKLENIVFHEKLGTVADKVERVAKLARWLCEEGIVTECAPAQAGVQKPSDAAQATLDPGLRRGTQELADLAEQAARLCKADLVTEMVGEFPELQGLMGGYYAEKEGLPAEVSAAIRDHYKPVGQGDDVPTAPVTVAVSLADKLDTLVGFFEIGEKPTGSKDPFALRRAAIGSLQLIFQNDLKFNCLGAFGFAVQLVSDAVHKVSHLQQDKGIEIGKQAGMLGPALRAGNIEMTTSRYGFGENVQQRVTWELLDFFADRLKVQQREAGVRHDLIDAVFALGGEDDLVRLLARVKALQAFVETVEGANLLAGYKRAANILTLRHGGVAVAQPLTGGALRQAQLATRAPSTILRPKPRMVPLPVPGRICWRRSKPSSMRSTPPNRRPPSP